MSIPFHTGDEMVHFKRSTIDMVLKAMPGLLSDQSKSKSKPNPKPCWYFLHPDWSVCGWPVSGFSSGHGTGRRLAGSARDVDVVVTSSCSVGRAADGYSGPQSCKNILQRQLAPLATRYLPINSECQPFWHCLIIKVEKQKPGRQNHENSLTL